MSSPRTLAGYWLGRRRYEPVHQLQQRLLESRQRGECGDVVLIVEHDPVITLGRGAHASHLLVPPARLAELGVDLIATGRGGDVTLHAPGQLVVYPIVDLSPDRRDVRKYVSGLAGVMQSLVAPWGVQAGLVDGLVGLWVDAANPGVWQGQEHATRMEKIGAIGVRISRWVTMHGFALNLTTELSLFQMIVPCGIREHGVTSLVRLTGGSPTVAEMSSVAAAGIAAMMGADLSSLTDLSAEPATALESIERR
jgi:lipoyl(octanoyl) transferase